MKKTVNSFTIIHVIVNLISFKNLKKKCKNNSIINKNKMEEKLDLFKYFSSKDMDDKILSDMIKIFRKKSI